MGGVHAEEIPSDKLSEQHPVTDLIKKWNCRPTLKRRYLRQGQNGDGQHRLIHEITLSYRNSQLFSNPQPPSLLIPKSGLACSPDSATLIQIHSLVVDICCSNDAHEIPLAISLFHGTRHLWVTLLCSKEHVLHVTTSLVKGEKKTKQGKQPLDDMVDQ